MNNFYNYLNFFYFSSEILVIYFHNCYSFGFPSNIFFFMRTTHSSKVRVLFTSLTFSIITLTISFSASAIM
ncbi:hypothetical protein H8356DRAFT_1743593 [Neocallimastix lanati (nom. inval.)]|nr:hypothetical protein H8356DRAFT_1743593 [Neocallimastix sp. JGI-2020a]